jgi:hypothetical protein
MQQCYATSSDEKNRRYILSGWTLMNTTRGVSMQTTNIWLDFNEHKSEYDLSLKKHLYA